MSELNSSDIAEIEWLLIEGGPVSEMRPDLRDRLRRNIRSLIARRADDAGRLTGAVERIKAMPFMVYTRFLKTGAEEFLPRASVFAALGIAPASPSAEPCGSVGCMGPESKWACSKCKPAHPVEGGL